MIAPPSQASAPGKVILFGEHAVVYGRPAIAVPVTDLRATATVVAEPAGSGLTIISSELRTRVALRTASRDEPLAAAARLMLTHLGAPEPDATLTIQSEIPIASGLGSGAAVAAAAMRGLAAFVQQAVGPADLSRLVFEVERIHHGTPSGIDNSVVVYEAPVFFRRGHPVEYLSVGAPIRLLIADTGIRTTTKEVVQHVRTAWEHQPTYYDALFDEIGRIAETARRSIRSGDTAALGPLMALNHKLLSEIGVSSERLDQLVHAARLAGARGAKLSGAGQGGNVIVLVDGDASNRVARRLRQAGAIRVLSTQVNPADARPG